MHLISYFLLLSELLLVAKISKSTNFYKFKFDFEVYIPTRDVHY